MAASEEKTPGRFLDRNDVYFCLSHNEKIDNRRTNDVFMSDVVTTRITATSYNVGLMLGQRCRR